MTTGDSSTGGLSAATPDWRAQLNEIDSVLRKVSTLNDPQEVVNFYGDAFDKLFPCDEFVAVSRRDLESPRYRITRSSRWSEDIDPWRERARLPVFDRGILGELLYADRPEFIDDLRVQPSDPAYEHLHDARSLLALPTYDGGVALNMAFMLWREPNGVAHDRIPMLHWQGGAIGRATLNLVLRRQLKEAYDALDRELQAVADIQRSLLPDQMPRIPGATLAARYETSARAGGDLYDTFPLPDGAFGLFIADVSGHGTPAAVGMAMTHALAHAHPGPPTPPEQMLGFLNRHLASTYARLGASFVTAIYAIFDPKTRTLTHACAGHPAPRVVRNGQVRPLDNNADLPLGIDPDVAYPCNTSVLQPGDIVLFYTDGITETFAPDGSMFGVDGLDREIARAQSPQEAVDNAIAAVDRFRGAVSASDDRTALCLALDR